ncbi:MAG: DUF3990 domain-containing protein [Eggerthellaceae bacterium]|nr:DUF3990 domain-containing protein [Eggerthellaceae bacterium]
MQLYHGSNLQISCPRLLKTKRRLDFGAGFYLTSDFEQAKRWAKLKVIRATEGLPIVSCYDFDESKLSELKTLIFETASVEWLYFISEHRKNDVQSDRWDVVIGPVADDTTMPVLRLFFANIYTEEETIKRLKPQNLTDQYVFKTSSALNMLNFIKGENV